MRQAMLPLYKKVQVAQGFGNNGWINKVLQTEARSGREKALERGRGIAMSLSLGREFGESMQVFEQRKPDIGEFYKWWNQYSAG